VVIDSGLLDGRPRFRKDPRLVGMEFPLKRPLADDS
jgi:hypothetical protein